MKFEVLNSFKIKTEKGIVEIRQGQILEMDITKALKLVETGKIQPISEPEPQITGYELAERMAIMGENCEPIQVLPYVTESGVLVIPFNSDPKYHYWKPGGQSVCTTLKELGRCDLIERYKSFYCN